MHESEITYQGSMIKIIITSNMHDCIDNNNEYDYRGSTRNNVQFLLVVSLEQLISHTL